MLRGIKRRVNLDDALPCNVPNAELAARRIVSELGVERGDRTGRAHATGVGAI